MELSSILDALNDTSDSVSEHTKTASHVSDNHSNKLEAALNAALSMDKTASEHSFNSDATPTQDLVKIAQKLADAEQLALIKEAEMYGAAVCDGFIARMGEHDSNGVKVASFSGGSDVDEVLLKQAMELGYRETMQELTKIAQDSYSQGYENTIAPSQDQLEAEKIASAALQQGYAEGQQMIKVAAEDRAQRGYDHAINILGSLA